MPFSPGQPVLVRSLNRRGEVLERYAGGYRVVVGSLTMACRESDLQPVAVGRRQRSGRERGRPLGASDAEDGGRSTLDLHGFTVEQAREALLRHLDAAFRAGDASVEIIHGIGTGKVKAAVLKELKGIEAVRQVKPHPTNPGSTLVYL
jgi:DNA mismatch repair protein MutS2